MIFGIGIDIVKTERMKKAVERWGNRFLKRVFTAEEISYAFSKSNPYLPLAVRFAAKEALIKAVGVGVAISFTDIEIFNYASGRPDIRVKGGLSEVFQKMSIKSTHLSLSHEQEYGVACVVLEK